ncbi:MAG: SRPBCC family protein [Chloroflexi bacterium]|nr:SRPBCC family protein [Chloroflexota bacterium]
MTKVEKSIEIAAPAKEVFEYVATHSNTRKFMSHVLKFEPVSSRVYGLGSRFRWETMVRGLRLRSEFEVTEFVPHERMSARTISGFRGASKWLFKPVENGTEATFITYYDPPASLLGRLVGKLMIHEELEGNVRRSLKNLKKNLENAKRPQGSIGEGQAGA